MNSSGQTETVSVRFWPKISACFGFLPFRCFGRNTIFGQNSLFLPKYLILADFGCTLQYKFNCQNRLLWPKKVFWPKQAFSVSAQISAFPRVLASVLVFRPKICFVCPLQKSHPRVFLQFSVQEFCLYRVAHLVAANLLLTSNWKLHFSISVYCESVTEL